MWTEVTCVTPSPASTEWPRGVLDAVPFPVPEQHWKLGEEDFKTTISLGP